mmetsp:Transcript_10661/g.12851  ORF Transcript_10661/g.12851 Transcript_10661/m.12851 type:complete len:305 (-) Transcript_10661:147-1061(-)
MAENLESGWILLVISAFNLVATNGVLTTSHWMAAFEAQSKATGIFILDLLIYFFQDILSTEAGRTIFETIFSFAMVSVTLVLYEGSRKRDKYSQIALALFGMISQFVGIAFATPLYLYFISNAGSYSSHVGTFRSIVNILFGFITFCFTVIIVYKQDVSKAPVEMTCFLLVPVVGNFINVVLDMGKSKPKMASNTIHFLLYYLAVPVGVFTYYRLLRVLYFNAEGFANAVLSNGAYSFLAIDAVGLIAACYLWYLMVADIATLFKTLPLLFLLGPTAHFAILCIVREMSLNAETELMEEKVKSA